MIVEEQTFEKENKDGEIGNENFENSKSFSEVFHQKKLLVTSILVIKQTKAPKDQVIQNKLTIFISYLFETVLKFLILLFQGIRFHHMLQRKETKTNIFKLHQRCPVICQISKPFLVVTL